jgi:D-threo-aldose 1-dehydrogenase
VTTGSSAGRDRGAEPAGVPSAPLPNGALTLSRLALGGAAIGGLYESVAERDAHRTVARALELGIHYIDTAPHYGAGLSELRLGAALRTRPRDSFVVSTKVGRLLEPVAAGERAPTEGFVSARGLRRVFDFSRTGILRSLRESLDRLELERVDIVYLHDPDDYEAAVRREAYAALRELRRSGVVRAIGAGMNQTAMLARLVTDLDLDLVLVAGRYTLLDQSALTELFPACRRRGVGVVLGAPFNGGLLAAPEGRQLFDYRPLTPQTRARVRRIQELCARFGGSLIAAALQFPLAHPAVVSVLAGARSANEIEANARAIADPVPARLWRALANEGLIAAGAPVPSSAP